MGPAWYSRLKQFNSMLPDGWDSTRLHQKTLAERSQLANQISYLAGSGWDVLFNRNCSILYHVLQSVLCPTEHNWGVGTRPIVERHPWSTGRNCSWCHHFCVFVFLCLCICICICIVSMRGILDPQLLLPSSQWSSVSWSLSRIPAGQLRECGAECGSQFAETIQLCSQ